MVNLIHGDCIEIMKSIESKSVDMVLTDPPYGTTNCRWDSVIPLEPMWKELNRIIKTGGAIVINAAQPFTSMLILSNPKMFKYCWIWEKSNATGFLNAKKQPLRAHEDIVVFYSSKPTYNPQKTTGHPRKTSSRKTVGSDCYGKGNKLITYDSTERYPRSVLKFQSDKQKSKLHPTQKPIALLEYLIKTYSNENDTVLDFAMGSGTTGVACKNLSRNFIGIERDDNYFEIAKNRITIANPTGQTV